MKYLSLLLTLFGAGLFAGLLAGCNGQASELDRFQETAAEKRMPVPVTTVVAQDFERTLTGTGSLRAARHTMITPEVSGRIVSLPFDVGARVKAGDELVRIRPDEYEDQVRQASAALEVAQAQLRDVLAGERKETVQSRQAALEESQAALKRAQGDFERNREMLTSGAISEAQFDKFREDYNRAQAAVEAARANLRSAASGPTSTQIGVARAEVKVREADLAEARRKLHDTVIRAPYDGAITGKYAELGEQVNNQMRTEILAISDLSTLEAWFLISESLAPFVRIGEVGRIEVVSTGRVVNAAVSAVNPAAEESVRSFLVKAAMPNADGSLQAGLFVRGTIVLERHAGVPAVPHGALRYLLSEGKGTGVENHNRAMLFLLDDDNVIAPLEVHTGLENADGYVEILSQLEPGRRLVADGALPLVAGQRVLPESDMPPAAATSELKEARR